MKVHDYYALRRDDAPLMPVTDGVLTTGVSLSGYVACFSDLGTFLSSNALLVGSVGYVDNKRQMVVAFEADPIETLDPLDREELAAIPLAVRTTSPLRAFLNRVVSGGASGLATKAAELIERIEMSLLDEDDAIEDPEDEFSRGPYAPDPKMVELLVLAPHTADMLAREEGPWVEGRALPRGYRPGYYGVEDLIASNAAEIAAITYLTDTPAHVFTVRCEDDMLYFPEAIDLEEPTRIYFKPIEVVDSVPLPEWLDAIEVTKDESTERMVHLRRSLPR